jgi:hypothetical protein
MPRSRQRDEFGLLPKWRSFADRVLAGDDATHAYQEVYGSKITTARTQACLLLQRPVVAEYIEGRRDRVAAEALKKLQVDADWILTRAVKVVERCMQEDTFDAAGAIRALKLLSENCPEWGAQQKQANGLPVFVVLTR